MGGCVVWRLSFLYEVFGFSVMRRWVGQGFTWPMWLVGFASSGFLFELSFGLGVELIGFYLGVFPTLLGMNLV